jgi:hypothetical protein
MQATQEHVAVFTSDYILHIIIMTDIIQYYD